MSSRGRWVLRGREMWEVAAEPGLELRTFCLPSSSPDGSAAGLGLTVALLSGGPNDPTRTGHEDMHRPAPHQRAGWQPCCPRQEFAS